MPNKPGHKKPNNNAEKDLDQIAAAAKKQLNSNHLLHTTGRRHSTDNKKPKKVSLHIEIPGSGPSAGGPKYAWGPCK